MNLSANSAREELRAIKKLQSYYTLRAAQLSAKAAEQTDKANRLQYRINKLARIEKADS